ncbi:hypothetical protein Tco_0329035 [Tanacetum coccineum]
MVHVHPVGDETQGWGVEVDGNVSPRVSYDLLSATVLSPALHARYIFSTSKVRKPPREIAGIDSSDSLGLIMQICLDHSKERHDAAKMGGSDRYGVFVLRDSVGGFCFSEEGCLVSGEDEEKIAGEVNGNIWKEEGIL